MSSRFINVLHLSDFHHQVKTEGSEDVVVTALLRDLDILKHTELAPDLCVFSGDLVYAGDDNAFQAFREKVLDRVSASLGLGLERFILCPGNHDIQRSIAQAEKTFVLELRSSTRSRDLVSQAFEDGTLEMYGQEAFGSYLKFVESLSQPTLSSFDSLQHIYQFSDLGLSAVALNSAILSFGGIKSLPSDERQLLLPEQFFLNGSNSLSHLLPDLVVQHHPPEFLNEVSRELYVGERLGSSNLLAFGHMHRPRPICSFEDEKFRLNNQAGALFYNSHRDDGYKGYAVVTIDRVERQYKVTHKKYYNDRLRFDLSLDAFTGGVYYSSPSARGHFATAFPTFSRAELLGWASTTYLGSIEELFQRHESRVGAGYHWVEPEFELEGTVSSVKPDIVLPRRPEVCSLQALIDRPDNILVEGHPESGKSVSLLLWAQRRCQDAGHHERIPVVLRWSELPTGPNAFSRLIRKALPSLPNGYSVDDLLLRGSLEILIDDFSVEHNAVECLKAAVQSYPGCRFVVAYKTRAISEFGFASFVPEDSPFLSVRLKQLKRGQVRALLRQRITLAKTGEDALLKEIMREVEQNNLPLTPFTIASIVDIYSRDGALQFKNKANFVERLIEVKLEKFAASEINVGTFDYDNKMHCLSELACWMVGRDEYAPREDDVRVWIKDYIDHHGFPVTTSKLLKEFYRSGLLQEGHDQTRFSYRVFLEYFVARKMADDEEFRDGIVSERNYLAFQNEISLYFALTRKDAKLLEEVARRLDGIAEQLTAQQFFSADAGADLDLVPVTSDAATKHELDAYEQRVRSPQLTDEERDALLDAETARDVGERQEVFRPKLQSTESQWLYALILYSSMVRSSDFLPASDKKMHLERALSRWLQFLQFSLNIIPPLAEVGYFRIDGVDYRIPGLMELKTKPERFRALQVLMPIGVSRMIGYHLNTDKLRMQIKAIGGPDESGFSALMRLSMLLDLNYENLPADMAGLFTKIGRKSRYAEYIALRKASDAYTHDRIRDEDADQFRTIVAESVARLRVGSKGSLSQEKAKVLTQLNRSRLQIAAIEKSDSK